MIVIQARGVLTNQPMQKPPEVVRERERIADLVLRYRYGPGVHSPADFKRALTELAAVIREDARLDVKGEPTG